MKIAEHSDGLVVRYRRPRGGTRKDFDLCLHYLNGTEVGFVLTAEREKDGRWRVLQAAIDAGETEMVAEAAQDFSFLRWYVFPKKERGRVLPPVVALWDVGGLSVAACLPPERGGKALPLAQQERWFSDKPGGEPPDPDRLLCWWPDPEAWESSKEIAKTCKLLPLGSVDVSFFTFSQWKQRTDVKREFEELAEFLEESESGLDAEFSGDFDLGSKEINAEVMAETLA